MRSFAPSCEPTLHHDLGQGHLATLGHGGFHSLADGIMKPITWSLGRLMTSANFTGSKPIIGQESQPMAWACHRTAAGWSRGQKFSDGRQNRGTSPSVFLEHHSLAGQVPFCSFPCIKESAAAGRASFAPTLATRDPPAATVSAFDMDRLQNVRLPECFTAGFTLSLCPDQHRSSPFILVEVVSKSTVVLQRPDSTELWPPGGTIRRHVAVGYLRSPSATVHCVRNDAFTFCSKLLPGSEPPHPATGPRLFGLGT